MPQLTINLSYSVDGQSYAQNGSVQADGKIERKKENFAAALVGQLTTRTDNDTGVITFASDPGLSVGARVDVYFNNGVRRGMKVSAIGGSGPWTATVGTGVGDVGAGDNLPPVNDPVTVGKVLSWDFNVLGNNIVSIIAAAAGKGVIVLASGTETEEYAAVFPGGAGVQAWYAASGIANPVAGDTLTKVFMSNGDSTGTKEVKICALVT